MAITTARLSQALTAAGLPAPSPHFLNTLLTSQRTQPPLAALVATGKHRLLSADLTQQPCCLAAGTAALPPHATRPQVREWKLEAAPGGVPVPVQVLAVEDLSHSRWEQVEAIEAQERGETMRGREIIRVVAGADEEGGEGQGQGRRGRRAAGANNDGDESRGGPHRLVLQDVKGQTIYGLELKAVEGIGVGMSIGTKIMLKGATVARGVVLLEPETTVVLGGKIDALHKAWVENRKRDLLAAIQGTA